MERNPMQQRVKEVMARAFGLPEADIPDDAAFGALQGWDSLGHISLMMALETDLGVQLTTEAMRQALTLPALTDFVTQARKK